MSQSKLASKKNRPVLAWAQYKAFLYNRLGQEQCRTVRQMILIKYIISNRASSPKTQDKISIKRYATDKNTLE